MKHFLYEVIGLEISGGSFATLLNHFFFSLLMVFAPEARALSFSAAPFQTNYIFSTCWQHFEL